MCLPICAACGKPIKVGDHAVRISKGEFDLLQEFQEDDVEVVHEECLADHIV